MPKEIDPEVRARAVRLVKEHRGEYPNLTAASQAVTKQVGVGLIDAMRSLGHAVESVCRVLREQGCQIAARTYRSWKSSNRAVAARTISDAHVMDAVREIAWTLDHNGRRRLTPEGLYGRRKMTAYVRRTVIADASLGSVDRAMRTLGLAGVRHAATTNQTDLVMIPLRMALWQRGREEHPTVPRASIHDSDGSQYTSLRLTERVALEQIRPSIGSVRDSFDKALMETINGLYRPGLSRRPLRRASPTTSTPPQAGSTGTTSRGSTARWAKSHRSNTSKATTLPPTQSRNPYASGTEPGAL